MAVDVDKDWNGKNITNIGTVDGVDLTTKAPIWDAKQDALSGDVSGHYHSTDRDLTNATGSLLTTQLLEPDYVTASVTKTGQPLFDVLRADRTAFLPYDQIIIEQSTDAGVTWTTASISDTSKTGLFSGTRPSITIPRKDGVRNTDCMIRVTITGMKYNVPDGTAETDKYQYWNSTNVLSTERYCQLSAGWAFVSSVSDRIYCKIEAARGGSSDTWVSMREAFMSGWSGGNFFSVPTNVFGGGTTQTSNYWNWRFTFRTATNSNDFDNAKLSTSSPTQAQNVTHIKLTGPNVWSYSNSMMYDDHIYSWDASKNTTFPARVTSTEFYEGSNRVYSPNNIPAHETLTGLQGGAVNDRYHLTASEYQAFSGVGFSGISGWSGWTGDSGQSGWSGWTGDSGWSGWTGKSGISGPSGQSGWSGWSGQDGIDGVSGQSGWSGWTGKSGISGPSGQSGWSGWTGDSGQSGWSGKKGDTGNTGTSGQSGWSGWTGDSGQSGWSGWSGQKGETGDTGASGQSGWSGKSGTNGTNGASGQSGWSGWTGKSGINGTSGQSGWSGWSGPKGDTGNTGASGQSGQNGTNGASGQSGWSGWSGPKGNTGNTGATGTSGQSGWSGWSGPKGDTGNTGASGQSGWSGKSGTNGTNGASGQSGWSGKSGQTGWSGWSGAPGPSLLSVMTIDVDKDWQNKDITNVRSIALVSDVMDTTSELTLNGTDIISHQNGYPEIVNIAIAGGQIVENSEHRFVTDTEKFTWNSKSEGTHTHTLSNITDAGTAAARTAGASAGNVPIVGSTGLDGSRLLTTDSSGNLVFFSTGGTGGVPIINTYDRLVYQSKQTGFNLAVGTTSGTVAAGDHTHSNKAGPTIILTGAGAIPSATAGCASPAKWSNAGTNVSTYITADFDKDTAESAEWTVTMPNDYDGGTVSVRVLFSSTGTGYCVWTAEAKAISSGEALDTAYGSSTNAAAEYPTANYLGRSTLMTLTIGNSPVGGDLVQFRITRNATDVGDSLSADARLHSVQIDYNTV